MKSLAGAVVMVFAGAYALMAQSLSCRDQGGGDLQFCEIRENTIPAGGLLSVDGKVNGGVSVIGSNRSDILVRAMVQARDRSAGSQVVVHTSSGAVSADGPAGAPWSVSYEILVPIKTDLRLTTHNGGVAVSGVRSSIEFHAVNGGVSIRDAGGNVRGETVNGGISLKISDQQWNGQGIDVSTTNGGVSVKVPEHFSGLLDLATVNGGMSVKLPGAQIDPNQRRLSMNVGAGGPPVRVHTQNGGVSLASGL